MEDSFNTAYASCYSGLMYLCVFMSHVFLKVLVIYGNSFVYLYDTLAFTIAHSKFINITL